MAKVFNLKLFALKNLFRIGYLCQSDYSKFKIIVCLNLTKKELVIVVKKVKAQQRKIVSEDLSKLINEKFNS